MYDLICVGSGPTTLGCCFELLSSKPLAKILVIEKELISCGGLRNDCKQNYTYPVGFPTEFWSQKEAEKYLQKVENFLKPNIKDKYNLSHYKQIADRLNVSMLEVRQAHLGTDGGKKLIEKLTADLKSKGVEFKFQEEFVDYSKVEKCINVVTDKCSYSTCNLLIAPGRHGFDMLRIIMKKHNIQFCDNSIDVGVRVETKLDNYPIVKDYYDPKFLFPSKTRTFCTNSGNAHVVQEKYTSSDGKDYYLVNGHAYSSETTPNNMVNFAMLRTNFFTEPMASGQDFAEYLAKMAMLAGGGHPIYQRVEDIRLHTRSTAEGEKNFNFKPTLSSAIPGDITMVMPTKFFNSIWKSLKLLDTIVPGVLNPNTILYYPEIKLYANKPVFKNIEGFEMEDHIFGLGDGAGTSRGITAAWASGMRSANYIIENSYI
jgi:uncharacterized protein